jgi:shikimate kinase
VVKSKVSSCRWADCFFLARRGNPACTWFEQFAAIFSIAATAREFSFGDMDGESYPVEITVRRQWRNEPVIYLIGPGGVGKSTLGRALAEVLKRTPIDLDDQFCGRMGNVGTFIRREGYERYVRENSVLAQGLVGELQTSSVLATSSGFLAADAEPAVRDANLQLIKSGYSISLLPSADLEVATSIIVTRQLRRGFGLNAESERRKFRERFNTYHALGDMLVLSAAPVASIAAAVVNILVTKQR